MEVNRLLGDEISYELVIRGLPVLKTVAENRSTLRGAFRMEREGLSSLSELNVTLPSQEELDICSGKLDDLCQDIKSFDFANRENEYKRISTRLYHIQLRLKRIVVSNQEMTQHRSELLGKCLQLLDALGMLNDNPNEVDRQNQLMDQENPYQGSILDLDNPLLPEIASVMDNRIDMRKEDGYSIGIQGELNHLDHTEERERRTREHNFGVIYFSDDKNKRQPQAEQSNVRPSIHYQDNILLTQPQNAYGVSSNSVIKPNQNINTGSAEKQNPGDLSTALEDIRTQLHNLQRPSFYRSSPNDVYTPSTSFDVSRWKIQFDGESSVANFLERIEELRLSRGVSKEHLLQRAYELFTKDALTWLRTKEFGTWDQLVEQLRNDFQPYDYEFDLMEEIRRRTQGSKERVVTYIAAMENLFKKLGLSRPNEAMRVKLIRRNLLPYIQTQLALHYTDTITELTAVCKSIEETAVRTQKFQPPPTNYRQLLEPELAYRKPASNYYTANQSVARIEANDVPSSYSADNISSSAVLCWNCGKQGHRFKKCSIPRKIFCFKCGKGDVVASNCPNCQKNGKRGST